MIGTTGKNIEELLHENGFVGRYNGGWMEVNVRRFLIGKVLGFEESCCDDERIDVEFNEGTPENFMLTCDECRDDSRFDVEEGDEVAVLEFDNGESYVIDRKLTKAQAKELKREAIAKAEEKARRMKEDELAKAERRSRAEAYVAGVDAAGGIKSLNRECSFVQWDRRVLEWAYGDDYVAEALSSPSTVTINGNVVPKDITTEVMEVLAPRIQEAQEKAREKRRLELLHENFTPEQLERAVAAYHAS